MRLFSVKWPKVKNSGTNYYYDGPLDKRRQGVCQDRGETRTAARSLTTSTLACVSRCASVCSFYCKHISNFDNSPSAARQLCQMQRICLAATLVQGCHNEAKAFFGAIFKLYPQQRLRRALLEHWPSYLEVGGSSPDAETFACLSVHLFVHFTTNILPILTTSSPL